MMPPRNGRSPGADNAGATATTIVETVTDQSSGPAVQSSQFAEADAIAITAAIRSDLRAAWDKVAAAYHGRAWVPLGYDSWDDYCEAEFDGSRIRIPREQRRDVVTSLREEGLSLRAIAAVTGQNERTIRRDLASPAANAAPASEQPATTGLDGKTYTRTTPPAREEVIDAEVVEENAVLAMSQPARLGPRSKHLAILDRIANAMQGYEVALAEIAVLDCSVTRDEAARLRGEFLRSRKSIDRMTRLLKVAEQAELGAPLADLDGGDLR